jgi:hypothetical protein
MQVTPFQFNIDKEKGILSAAEFGFHDKEYWRRDGFFNDYRIKKGEALCCCNRTQCNHNESV